MDRAIIYTQEQGRSTDILFGQQAAMVGVAKLTEAVFGTNTFVNGLTCTPTAPATMSVQISKGEIYSLQPLEATAYGVLPADTTDTVMKQGIMLAGVQLSCPAPLTTGQSINYLIQAAYADQDGAAAVLPYFNSANPSQPLSGQNNSGAPQNTQRKGIVLINAKAGAPAATGSQTTPAPDAGYVGLYVVTVAYGASSITSGNIAVANGAPIAVNKFLQLAALSGAAFTGAVSIGSTLNVSGATTLAGLSASTGTFSSTLNVSGATTLAGLSASTGTFSSTLTASNGLTASGYVSFLTGALEIGNPFVAGSAHLDFHSSGNNIDYDAQVIASGGTASIGNGVLTYTANGGHFFYGAATFYTGVVATTLSATDIQIRSLNQNVSSTLPRAWVLFNGTTGAITSSFNISSVTRIAAGRYTVTFTNPFTSTTYAVFGTAASSTSVQGVVSFNPASIAVNSIEVDVQSISGTPALTDFNQVRVSFIGV